LHDEVFDRAGAATTVGLRPRHADPAAGCKAALPRTEKGDLLLEVVEAGRKPFAVLPRQIGHEVGAQLLTELLLVGRGAQVHSVSS
jgi:hypothetical protein